MNRRWYPMLPVFAAGLVGAVVAIAVTGGSGTRSSTTTTVFAPSAVPTALTQTKGLTINQIYKLDSPGVVDILVTQTTGSISPFGGAQKSQGEGAGVVYDKSGNILTDEHVVTGAQSVKVTFQDGLVVPARVIGADPSTDVAVIHVNVPSAQLHAIPLADSATSQVGDPVVAIGSPFSLPETVTSGIVSQVGRSITAPNGFRITGAIQTDAAINPGNSGGPLLDAGGKVLGLNDQIQTSSGSSAGVGFAVPSNTVARVANAFIAGKQVRHAYVGVCLQSTSTGGARIAIQSDPYCTAPVVSGSPADRAGLHPGDVITAVNGKSITSTEQFIATVDTYHPGQTVTLTVNRGGATRQFQLKLGDRPGSAPNAGG